MADAKVPREAVRRLDANGGSRRGITGGGEDDEQWRSPQTDSNNPAQAGLKTRLYGSVYSRM